jgi:hypothetical protein
MVASRKPGACRTSGWDLNTVEGTSLAYLKMRGDQTLAVLGKTGQKGMGEKSIDMTIRCRLNVARTGGVVLRVCWPLSTHRRGDAAMKETRLNIVSKSTLAIVAMLSAACHGGGGGTRSHGKRP